MGKWYKLLNGISYQRSTGKEEWVAPGTVVDDLPENSLEWLLEQNQIVETMSSSSSAIADVRRRKIEGSK